MKEMKKKYESHEKKNQERYDTLEGKYQTLDDKYQSMKTNCEDRVEIQVPRRMQTHMDGKKLILYIVTRVVPISGVLAGTSPYAVIIAIATMVVLYIT
jgi:hypothetical protein